MSTPQKSKLRSMMIERYSVRTVQGMLGCTLCTYVKMIEY